MHRNALNVSFALALSMLLPACDRASDAGAWSTSGSVNLSTPVLYRLDGKSYDIPLSYHSMDRVSRDRWPTPRTQRRDVDYISIMGLLPGFTPFREQDAAAFNEPGPGTRVDVLVGSASNGHPRPMTDYLAFLRQGGRLRDKGQYQGLKHFFDTKRSDLEAKGADLYVKEDEAYFQIYCDRTPDNGLCQVSRIRDDGLYVQYSFSRRYLPQWRSIDQAITRSFDGFEVAPRGSPSQVTASGR